MSEETTTGTTTQTEGQSGEGTGDVTAPQTTHYPESTPEESGKSVVDTKATETTETKGTQDVEDYVYDPQEYDRDRMGLGVKYLRNGIRATAEYMVGEGMIWQAPHNSTFGIGPGQGIPGAAAGNGVFAEGTGYYVEGGWRIPKTKWEIDLRYDIYNRLDGNQFEIEFQRTTLGVQYFFNPRVRLAINYEARSAEAVNFPSGGGPNGNVDGIDDRIALQVTAIWSQ